MDEAAPNDTRPFKENHQAQPSDCQCESDGRKNYERKHGEESDDQGDDPVEEFLSEASHGVS